MSVKFKFIFLFIFFSGAVFFSQTDTSKVNGLNKMAWSLRSSKLDTSILLSKQVLNLLNTEFKNVHFPNNWEKKALVKTYYYLGMFYAKKGEITIPTDYFNKSLQLANEIGYEYGKSLALGGLGGFYLNKGNLSKALDYSLQALRIDEKTGNKEGELVRYSVIGSIYNEMQDHKKAGDYFYKELKLSEEIKDRKHLSIALGNLGITNYYLKDFEKSLSYYTRALAMSREDGNKSDIGQNLNNIASLLKDEKKYDEAYRYLSEAMALGKEQGDIEMESSALGNIGSIYKLKKEYARSEESLLKALKLTYSAHLWDATGEFEGAMYELYTEWGKPQLALEHYKKHIAARDTVYNAQNTERTVRTEMNYEFEKKQALAEAQHEREIISMEAENKIQKQLHIFLFVVIALILLVMFFMKRAYDDKKRIAQFLESETQRKEVLLQEVHHRINNNLQIISSLLSLQASSAQDERLNEFLKQSQNRIQSLSAMHELLYQTDSLLEINMQEYLEKVLSFHRDVLSTKPIPVSLNTDIAAVSFPTKTAVPIALIVNELITNSIKYAFDAVERGQIRVSLQPEDAGQKSWILTVSDNGKGLPEDGSVRQNSLGLRLVNIMVKQMSALFTRKNDPGASFTVRFSL